MPYMSVDGGNTLVVEDCYDQKKVVSDIGGHWDSVSKVWRVTFTLYNLRYLLNHMDGLGLSDDIEERVKEQEEKEARLARLHDMSKQDIPIRLRVPGLSGSPYNYQRYGIMFAVLNGAGVLNADEMGLGKAQPLDCSVLTPTGWVQMGKLRPGMSVIGSDGKSCSVTGVFPQGEKDVYRILFSDGSSTRCCDEHLWSINTPLRKWRGLPPRIMSLSEVRKSSIRHVNGNRKYFIPLVSPVEFNKTDLPLHPYLMGVLIGDGGLTAHTPMLSSDDSEMVERVESLLPKGVRIRHKSGCDYFLTSGKRGGVENPLTGILRGAGLWGVLSPNKSVPLIYKFSCLTDRLEILRGLMDTDGWVSRCKRGNVIQFGSSSRELADDVVFLTRSLGGIASVKPKKTKSLPSYVVTLSLPSGVNPFRLDRKAKLVGLRAKYAPSRSIDEIEYVGKSECQCISVDASDGLYVTDDFIVTHNTLQAIATALYLKDRGLAKNALCVTPASLKYNWPIEIEKFTDERYVVIDGPPKDRISQWLRDDVFFYVVNYELILEDLFGGRNYEPRATDKPETIARKLKLKAAAEKRERILGPVRRRMWDFISIDEAHAIKHHGSKRARNVKRLRSHYRMALTGTPIDGRLEELHSIMDWVAPGLLGSKTRFYQRHVETDFWGKVTGYKRIDEVRERIQPFYIRRLKKQVLQDLPDKIYQNRVVVLSSEERKLYNALAKGGHEATEDVEAMVAIIRCKQFCDCPSLVDDTCKRSSKMDALRDILEEIVSLSGNKAILFSQYKMMLDILVPLLEDMGLQYLRIDGDTPKKDRAEMQAVFRDDDTIDMMVGTDAMSTGLNLEAASYVVNYDDFWSPSIMSQREDRCIAENSLVSCLLFGYDSGVSLVRIQDVKEGDRVLTHKGNLCVVSGVSSHEHRGMVTAIEYVGWWEPLVCTYDHKILIKRDGELMWVMAHTVLPSDSMVFPKVKGHKPLERVVIDDGWRLFPKPVTECVVCGEPVEARRMCRVHYREWLKKNRGKVETGRGASSNGRYVRLPDEITITDDWLRLLGWYAAEGFASVKKGKGRFISLSGHEDEESVLTGFGRVFDSLGVKWSIYRAKKTKGIELRAYSAELAIWFMRWFGHRAENKTLPDEIVNLPPHQASVFLRGYTDGDGHSRNKQVEWISASRTMCYQMCQLAIRAGHIPTMRMVIHPKTKNEHFIGGYTDSGSPSNKRLADQDDDYIYRPISRVETKTDKIRVYDLTVEDDHSFTVGFSSVHNCHRIGQKEVVTVVNFICRDTIEERIRSVIYGKNRVTAQVLGDDVEESVLKRLGPQEMAKLL